MIRFLIDEIGLMLLDKEDFGMLFSLNDKGKKQLIDRIEQNETKKYYIVKEK